MVNVIKNAIQEDTSLHRSCAGLWEVKKTRPEIRQIYGSFLPPLHLKTAEGLVAKNFAFPPDGVKSKMVSLSIDKNTMDQLYAIGERIQPKSFVSIDCSVKIRPESHGAVVYTSYCNGFYLNEVAYKILKLCGHKTSVERIASELGYNIKTVIDFLVSALVLGIVNVSL
jgi:hypothetical protein